MRRGLLPTYEELPPPDGTGRFISIPLWLLALLCLAWPVTSFILARRKPKRGFPVVQTELRDQKSEVSQNSGAPKGHLQPEPGASPRVGGGA